MKYLAVLLAGGGIYFAISSFWGGVGGSTSAAEVPATARASVQRGDLVITVTETGYLKAKNSEHVKPEIRRSGTITWLIDEGSKVEKDDLLVEFDKTDLEREIQDTENSLIQYEAELEAARATLAIHERDATANVEEWELTLEIANLNLERYLEGDAPNELRKLRLEKEKADSSFQRAKEQYEQVPQLEAEGFLTRIQAEEERIHLREQEILAENSQRELDLYNQYNYVITKAQKEADVKDANRELENARETATINLKEAQAKVTGAERQKTAAEEKLAELREEHGKMTIHSPTPGIVHYGDPARPWYHDDIKVGNSFRRGNTIITLPDLREMQVLVQVHEADIDFLAEGMHVDVVIEAAKGETFSGSITKIASVASSNWSDPTNKTFEVEISMEPIDRELRSGITARAEIQVETREDVLQVPVHSIFAEEGEHFVFVHDPSGAEKRPISIGKNNAHYVEFSEGLELAEEVLLYDPRVAGGMGSESSEEAGAGVSDLALGTAESE